MHHSWYYGSVKCSRLFSKRVNVDKLEQVYNVMVSHTPVLYRCYTNKHFLGTLQHFYYNDYNDQNTGTHIKLFI